MAESLRHEHYGVAGADGSVFLLFFSFFHTLLRMHKPFVAVKYVFAAQILDSKKKKTQKCQLATPQCWVLAASVKIECNDKKMRESSWLSLTPWKLDKLRKHSSLDAAAMMCFHKVK